MDSKRVFIVGGGQVETRGKHAFCKAAVEGYLCELADLSGGPVHWYTSRSSEGFLSTRIDPQKVVVFAPENSRQPSSSRRSILRNLKQVLGSSSSALGVIEYYPGLLGIGGFWLRLKGVSIVTYFGSDPVKRWVGDLSARPTASSFMRAAVMVPVALLSIAAANRVLVRDESQFKRLKRLLGPGVERARPVIVNWAALGPRRMPDEKEFRLLFVGVFRWRKRIDILLEAFAMADKQLGDACSLQLDVVGDVPSAENSGWDIRSLAELAQRLGIRQEKIRFHGYFGEAAELRLAYRAAHVLIQPSDLEGFPRVIDEAMLAGLPVIATSVPEIAGVLTDNENALLVPPGDVAALASAIVRLVEDGALFDRLARGSALRASSLITETAAQQHFRLLLAARSTGPKPTQD